MSNIWLISDTHLNHDKLFIWEARGFTSVDEMNAAIIERWNAKVQSDDIVYHLGDFIMGDLEAGMELVSQLNGHIRLAIGNHDTDARLQKFKEIFDDIQFGYRVSNRRKTFLLTHYPQLTGNYDGQPVFSIHGHTHSFDPFCEHELMYNVNCESQNCTPVLWEDMLRQIYRHKDKLLAAKDKNN